LTTKDEDRRKDIEKTRAQEQTAPAKREASETKKLRKEFSKKALRSMKAKDERAFAADLRRANFAKTRRSGNALGSISARTAGNFAVLDRFYPESLFFFGQLSQTADHDVRNAVSGFLLFSQFGFGVHLCILPPVTNIVSSCKMI
jgi:hypothetical protein